MNQPDLLIEAQRQRDAGMRRALDHADEVMDGWSDRAYDWICSYARRHKQFVSEECTQAAADDGFTSPTDRRAWGHPFRRAARAGIIRKTGYGVSLIRHCSPTILWQSLVVA